MDDDCLPSGRLSCSLNRNWDSSIASTQMVPQKGNGGGAVGSAAVACSMVGGRPKSAAVPGSGWANSNISSRGTPSHNVATSSASVAAAAGGIIDVDVDQGVEYSYFGKFPNPDPTDDSQLNISQSFTHLFVNLNKCSCEYKKPRKINIFYKVLCINKSVLLGNSPPKCVECIYLAHRQNVKPRSWWKLPNIAGPIYIMGKFVHKCLEAHTGHGKPNFKMEALSLMYSYFMGEIALEEEEQHSASKATMKSTKLSKATNPLPSDFVFYLKKVRLF
jgi:hypothetical protein